MTSNRDDEISMYDVSLDQMRPVTQEDVDHLALGVQVMSRSRRAQSYIEEITRAALRGNLPSRRFFEILEQLERMYTPPERLSWEPARHVAQEPKAAA